VEILLGECSLYSNHFGAVVLFIWSANGVPTHLFLALHPWCLSQGFAVMKKKVGLVCWTGHFWMSYRKPKTELCSCTCWKRFSLDEIAMSTAAHQKLTLKLSAGSSITAVQPGAHEPLRCPRMCFTVLRGS